MTNVLQTTESMLALAEGEVWVKQWQAQNQNEACPIILLHDSLGSVDLWRDFPAQLSEKLSRTVYAYDRLGFGRSTERESLPSVHFIEEEANIYFPEIKRQLGLKEYILIGHSVGGGMAINIAAQDSDCLAVISISAQAFVEDRTIDGIKAAKTFFAQPEQLKRLEKWHDDKAQWVLNAWTEVWLSPEFRAWNLLSALKQVKCPMLVIHGDKDEYGSEAFPQFIVEHSQGVAKPVMMDNCGHMPHKELTESVLVEITHFLESVL